MHRVCRDVRGRGGKCLPVAGIGRLLGVGNGSLWGVISVVPGWLDIGSVAWGCLVIFRVYLGQYLGWFIASLVFILN